MVSLTVIILSVVIFSALVINMALKPAYSARLTAVLMTIAALGGSVVVNTVDGKVIYDVKAGTQSETRIRLKGKGVPTIRNKSIRGDHYVTLVVETPTKLSKEAKDLLRQFDAITGDSLGEADRVTGADGEKPKKETHKKKKFWKS